MSVHSTGPTNRTQLIHACRKLDFNKIKDFKKIDCNFVYKGETPLTTLCKNYSLLNGSKPKKEVSKGDIITIESRINQIICLLISKGAKVNFPESCEKAPLNTLCKLSNCHDIGKPCHNAFDRALAKTASVFIKAGANLNQRGEYGIFPLMLACQNLHLGIAKKILNAKTDIHSKDQVDLTDDWGKSALYHALPERNEQDKMVLQKRLSLMKELLSHGGNILRKPFSSRIIHTIAARLPVDIYFFSGMKDHTKLKDYINIRDKKGRTPLHHAAKFHNLVAVKTLMALHAKFLYDKMDEDHPLYIPGERNHPLHLAEEFRPYSAAPESVQDEVCDLLRQYKTLLKEDGVNFKDKKQFFSEDCKKKIQKLVGIDLKSIRYNRILMTACNDKSPDWADDVSFKDFLLKNGNTDPNCVVDEATPLTALCRKHFHPTKQDSYRTFCHGLERAVSILIKAGANVNQCDKNGSSPLMLACRNLYFGVAKKLLENEKTDLHTIDQNGRSAVFCILEPSSRTKSLKNREKIRISLLEKFIKRGVNIMNRVPEEVLLSNLSSKKIYALRIIHVIAAKLPIDIDFFKRIKITKSHRAINVADYDGCTPLHYAAHFHNKNGIVALIKLNAKVLIDKKGKLPSDHASEKQVTDILKNYEKMLKEDGIDFTNKTQTVSKDCQNRIRMWCKEGCSEDPIPKHQKGRQKGKEKSA